MANFLSDYDEVTPEEWEKMESFCQWQVDSWMKEIAEYRKLNLTYVKGLAGGRIWTGRQAKANGLIDEVGGLDRAVEIAKDLAGIQVMEKVTLVHYPKGKSILEMITKRETKVASALNSFISQFLSNLFAKGQTMFLGLSAYSVEP